MITITEKAAQKIVEISDAEGIGHYVVRAKIMGGGCAGYQHDLSFDDKISDMDEVFTFDKVNLIIDPLSYQYLEEATIDYEDKLFGGGFKFISPNATGSCGCGKSVSY